MFRDDDETRHQNLHGTGRDGFATKNPPKGYGWTAPTLAFMNALQEQPANAIEMADRELVKASNKQLRSVLATFVTSNWKKHATGAADFVPRGLAYDPTVTEDRPFGFWIACGEDGKIATSLDGRTFTVVAIDGTEVEQYHGIAVAPGIGWLMVGISGTTPLAASSADGVTWNRHTARDENTTSDALRSCTWDADAERWIAVGDNGHMVWTTEELPDASGDWHGMIEFAEARPTTNHMLCMASDGLGTVVAMGEEGGIFTQDGGRHWSTVSGAGSSWRAVVWDGAEFQAFAIAGNHIRSSRATSDPLFGGTWLSQSIPSSGGTKSFSSAAVWTDAAGTPLPIITVAVCESGDMYLRDHEGTTSNGWRRLPRVMDTGLAVPLKCIVWGRGGFVALSASGELVTASLQAW